MPAPRMRLADNPDRPWIKPAGRPRFRWSITVLLIAINVVVYVAQQISAQIDATCDFTITDAIHRLQLWRWVTYMFLHSRTDAGHLVFNMLALWFFGPIVEGCLGQLRYICHYLICGIGGAFVYWLLYRMQFLDVRPFDHLLGASGAVLGVIAGGATIAPNRQMKLLFPPVTLRLVTIAWLLVGVALATIAFAGKNAGGEAAHLGGLVVGFVLIRNVRLFRLQTGVTSRSAKKFWKPGDPPERFFREDVP